jgi:biopolymer transport protein ExbD
MSDFITLRRPHRQTHIDVINLIDIMMVLLIFFVMSTTFNKETGIDVSKPKAGSAQSVGQKTILVGVSREGSIHAYGRQMDVDALSALLTSELQRSPELSVVIVADQDAALKNAVQVMDAATSVGVAKVSLAAENES